MIALSFSICGYAALLAVHKNTNKEYGLLFLAVAGNVSAMPIFVCWYSTNLRGHARRATGIAYQVSLGNVGGIISTYIYKTSDGPNFTVGYSTTMGFMGLAAISSTLYYFSVKRSNANMDKNDTEKGVPECDKEVKLYT